VRVGLGTAHHLYIADILEVKWSGLGLTVNK
jgi:hypothetical protein